MGAQFSDLRSRGLVNIASTRDFNNAVGLCNTCHIQFDHSPAAGFVFFPSDLNFFVDYEMRDRERRKNEALSQGPDAPPRPIRRRCPSAVQYHEHQQAAGVVAAEAVGGLYDRYMLREYFPLLGAGQVFAPAPWHGDPMTSLRRAFLQLGGLRAFKVSKATRKILFELLQLYYEEDTEEFELSQPEEQAAQVVEGSARDYLRTPTPSVQFSEGRRNESTAPQDLNARGFSVNDKASLALASPAANAKREQSQTFSPGTADAHQEWPEHGWEWGPGATAQHAVDFWTSIKNIPAQRNGKGSQAHAAH